MSWFKGLLARTRSVAGAQTSESRMEEEFQFHVEMETKRLVEQHGLSPDEARRRALVAFGGLDAHREEMRDGRGARWFDDLGADIRYALRGMRRAPGFRTGRRAHARPWHWRQRHRVRLRRQSALPSSAGA
jgi:hypothetical protein